MLPPAVLLKVTRVIADELEIVCDVATDPLSRIVSVAVPVWVKVPVLVKDP
jgi:hypothetical protein